jgi:abortive infection bacteriophage resistance protein
MKYTKPALSITDQIKLLESRNLIIGDHAKAAKYLSNISYYRLSGYMYPFKDLATNNFVGDVTFEEIIDLYVFDRGLRLLVFDAIETIEVTFRTQLIYHPSISGGAFWFEDASNFEDASRHTEHLRQLDEEVERSSGEVFIQHFFSKYDEEDTPPAGMTFEVLTLGLMSKFYQNMRPSLKAKKDIARHFGISHPAVFQSWVRSITYVRNICAHHSRLWNRVLTNKPVFPHTPPAVWISAPMPSNDKIYYFLCCLAHMLRSIQPKTTFVQRLKELLAKHPAVSKSAMGFPSDWESERFWQ